MEFIDGRIEQIAVFDKNSSLWIEFGIVVEAEAEADDK